MLRDGPLRVLGTMSGTSLDGVDAAVLETDGERIFGFGPTGYRPYTDDEQAILRGHLGRWPDDGVGEATTVVNAAHLDLMQQFPNIDLGGFHGQTLAHDPGGRGTHQCGDGQDLAASLRYPIAWDFRTADVDAGGQGAPLAPFFHFALAKWIGAKAPIAFLNLGGVGNITWVDPRKDAPEAPDALLAFDTGPANAPSNDFMQARRGEPYDADGALAAQGTVDRAMLAWFLAHPYFFRPAPKSLDRDAFPGVTDALAHLSDADALSTLAQIVVDTVGMALPLCPSVPETLLVTGGGRKNGTLMHRLATNLPVTVKPVEDVGLDGDMLEAQAFAYLAVRSVRGLPLSAPGTTGVAKPCKGGRVAWPDKSAP